MEEANEIGNAGTLRRLAGKALPLAFIAGLIGINSGPKVAAGGFFGAVASAIYAYGYLTSHLAAAGSEKKSPTGRSGLFSKALLRLAAVGGGGAAAYWAGRDVLIAYLASFGVAFGALVISEFPRIKQSLQQQGVLAPGDSKPVRAESSNGAAA